MKPHIRVFVILSVLALLALAITPLAAQDEARVRIGYFAFNPSEYDTYIDGELASFSPGWSKVGWNTPLIFLPEYRFDSATPYLAFDRGVHSLAFVPTGEDIGSAILGPQDVTFEAGHHYSLAVIGEMADDSLSLLTIDETEAFKGVDPGNNFMDVVVHDILGAPPIDIIMGEEVVVDNLEYGEWAVYISSEEFSAFAVYTAEDQPTLLFQLDPSAAQHRICALSVLTGSYPGEVGKDIFWDYNWNYAGEVVLDAGGEAAVGDALAGKIEAPTHRVAYMLNLDTDAVLDIFALATGPRTEDSNGFGLFDPILHIYDERGNLLFWSDDGVGVSQHKGGEAGAADAALAAISLNAGVYSVQVAGFSDLGAGPYALIIRESPSM